ncbi:MAG: hypothetical protein ACD_7C00580G0001 [uncultured bacterium]|nr:MAG: hypothetical protein ACD_7C00580G0001 [uncultured bacterium]
MKKLFWWLIFLIITFRLSIFIVNNRIYFLRPFDPVYFSKLYSQSQYVIGELSKGGIGDDGVYAFAGHDLVFNRGDVSSINFEHPPFGKYLIGLSILLFRNENIINIIYFVFILLFIYKISRIILKDKLLSLLSVAFFAFDPLINDNLLRSLLDLPFTLFFIAAVYFFIKGLERSKNLYLSFFFWGLAFASKFFPFFIFIYIFLMVIIFFYGRKRLLHFFLASFLVPLIYIISHTTFFIYHPSIAEFLRHKKWMVAWWTGSPVIRGNILRNIFTGTYIDSIGNLARNEYWTIFLPVVTTLSFLRLRCNIFKKSQLNILIIYGLSVIYFIYLIVFNNGIQKYLMPIYPLIIILAISNVSCIITSCRRRNLQK